MSVLGYKARALKSITDKGLPSLFWKVLDLEGYDFIHDADTVIIKEIFEIIKMFEFWAIRTDAPIRNDGVILPLFGSNKKSDVKETALCILELRREHPEYSFVLSEAPNDSTRDSNIVCWTDGDVLFGEIGFQPMTLRDAWVRGDLNLFAIDGGVGDFIRNKYLIKRGFLTENRLHYLRRVRNLLRGSEGFDYEISVTYAGRIIFWSELPIIEDRNTVMKECLTYDF